MAVLSPVVVRDAVRNASSRSRSQVGSRRAHQARKATIASSHAPPMFTSRRKVQSSRVVLSSTVAEDQLADQVLRGELVGSTDVGTAEPEPVTPGGYDKPERPQTAVRMSATACSARTTFSVVTGGPRGRPAA